MPKQNKQSKQESKTFDFMFKKIMDQFIRWLKRLLKD